MYSTQHSCHTAITRQAPSRVHDNATSVSLEPVAPITDRQSHKPRLLTMHFSYKSQSPLLYRLVNILVPTNPWLSATTFDSMTFGNMLLETFHNVVRVTYSCSRGESKKISINF